MTGRPDTTEPRRARIPADVERPDRILAGLTSRQLALLAVPAIGLWAGYAATRHFVPLPIFAALGAPIVVAALTLALGRRAGLPLDRLGAAALRQARAPHRLVPAPDGVQAAPSWAWRDVASLPRGARVGTSSLRRVCQLKARRPDLELVPLRGNVDTRLKKVQAGELDAIVLACAGLKRLGHAAAITASLSIEESLPAIGQGALAIECRTDDAATRARLAVLHHPATAHAVEAERGFLGRLEGDCKTPLAAHGILRGERVVLEGLVASPDGATILRQTLEGSAADGARLGCDLAELLLARGARELLAAGKTTS